MTDGSQEFCLRWNNHQATIISVFDYLLENETLVDCTLAAEGQYLKAHKVVLCACSPYLELLLSQHNDKHPILIFKDIKYNELKCMIEYMYKGEVNIAQDQLNHFLKAAESLQIKGLSESEEDAAPQTSIPAPRPPPPRAPPVQRTQPRPISSSVAVESPKRINRNEAASPTRKRRRLPIQGRPSLSGDDASNASESHLDQSNCDVPSNVQPSSDNAVAKLETNSELILEPKTEYDDNSVEDITLDDDEEDYSQAGTSMDNSQMNFSGWQGMDKSGGDEVFTGQDSGAQNSQDKTSSILLAHLQQVQKDLGLPSDASLSSTNLSDSLKDIPNNIDLSQIHKNLLQCNTGRFRQVYSSHQIIELEKEFRLTNYLPSDRRKVLSKELGLTERQIKIWFQNRRMKLKRTHPDMVVEYVKESSSDRKANSNSQNATPSVPSENNSNTHAKSFEDFIREHYERKESGFPPGDNHSSASQLELQNKALMEENASKLLLEKLREQTLEKHLREASFPLPPVGAGVGREELTDPSNFPALPPGQIEKLNDLYDNERNLLIQELIRNKLGLLIQNGRGSEEVPTDLSRRSKSDTEEEGEVKREFEEEDSNSG